MSKPIYTREQFLNTCITPATSSPFISTECSICQEQYSDSTAQCAVTFSDEETCNHVFCKTCITTWLSAESVNTCALCRRVLFVLEDHEVDSDYDDDEDDYEYSDEDSDEDDDGDDSDYEDDDEDLESEDLSEVQYAIHPELINNMLVSIWYKIWWRLSSYRSHVFGARKNSSQTSPRPANTHEQADQTHVEAEMAGYGEARHHLPNTLSLINSFQDTAASLVPLALAARLTRLIENDGWDVLEWLLHDMATLQIAHIEMTGGEDNTPDFPSGNQRRWSGALKRVLASV